MHSTLLTAQTVSDCVKVPWWLTHAMIAGRWTRKRQPGSRFLRRPRGVLPRGLVPPCLAWPFWPTGDRGQPLPLCPPTGDRARRPRPSYAATSPSVAGPALTNRDKLSEERWPAGSCIRTERWPTKALVCKPELYVRKPLHLLLQAWIQRIAQAITKHVEAKDGEENGQAGEDGDPRVVLNEHHIRPQIRAPTRGRRLCAQS